MYDYEKNGCMNILILMICLWTMNFIFMKFAFCYEMYDYMAVFMLMLYEPYLCMHILRKYVLRAYDLRKYDYG